MPVELGESAIFKQLIEDDPNVVNEHVVRPADMSQDEAGDPQMQMFYRHVPLSPVYRTAAQKQQQQTPAGPPPAASTRSKGTEKESFKDMYRMGRKLVKTAKKHLPKEDISTGTSSESDIEKRWSEEGRRSTKCPKCPADRLPFSSMTALRHHFRAAHKGEKIHKCTWRRCGKAFATPGTLKQHMKFHAMTQEQK